MKKLEKKSDIITSRRTFGIEIECGNKDMSAFDYLLETCGGWLRVIRDSSITLDNGKEIVTKILKGKRGAERIIKLCKYLNELNFITDDVSCGMHVHVDGSEFLNKNEIIFVDKGLDGLINDRREDIHKIFFVDKHCAESYGNGDLSTPSPYIGLIEQIHGSINAKDIVELGCYSDNPVYAVMDNESTEFPLYMVSTVDKYDKDIAKILQNKKIHEIEQEYTDSDGERTREWMKKSVDKAKKNFRKRVRGMFSVRDGKHVVVLNDRKPLSRVKTLMYFYVGFNDILQGMVAPSRKDGNAYCMPISDFFELEQVEKLKTYSDFEKMWYKDSDASRIRNHQSNHYNDSRYLDVNFHCMWNRTGTIELRAHGSTKDPNHILLWTALNQFIVDKVASDELVLEKIKASLCGCTSIEDKYIAMQACLDMPDYMQEYVKRLLNHFSSLKIK